MRSYLLPALWLGLSSAAFGGACGGKAIIDAPRDGSDGGASTTSSSGGSTSGCGCIDDADCPQNLDCQIGRCDACECSLDDAPDGTACSGGVCADGACVGCLDDEDCGPGAFCVEGSCVGDPAAVCDLTCTTIAACLGGGVDPMCLEACTMDLADCSEAQIVEVAACADILAGSCDVDQWFDCMQAVGCLDF